MILKAFLGSFHISTLVQCLVVFLLSVIVWFRRREDRVNKFMVSLPGPRPLPFIGNAHLFIGRSKNEMYNLLMSHSLKYVRHKIFRYKFPADDFAVLTDPQIIQTFLKSPGGYDKDREFYKHFMFDEVLFIANGKPWMDKRKSVVGGFHPKILATLDPIYDKYVADFLVNMKKHAETGKPFNLILDMSNLAFDIVGDTYMGVKMEALVKNDLERCVKIVRYPAFIMERVLFSLIRASFIFNMSGQAERHRLSAEGSFELLAKEALAKRKQIRAKLKENGEYPEAALVSGQKQYLDILIDLYEQSPDTQEMRERLIHEVGEMFVAASATVSGLASWVLLMSAVFPEVGEKLHNEIDNMIQSGTEPSIESCSQLEYLDMVMKECFRHFSVPLIIRQPQEDVRINGIGTIPAGARCVVNLTALHHHPDLWEKPLEFYPEHFLPENVAKRPKGSFLPFITGARECPGGKYSIQSIKGQVVRILSKVKFNAVKMKPWKNIYAETHMKFTFVQAPADGFKVTIEFKEKCPCKTQDNNNIQVYF